MKFRGFFWLLLNKEFKVQIIIFQFGGRKERSEKSSPLISAFLKNLTLLTTTDLFLLIKKIILVDLARSGAAAPEAEQYLNLIFGCSYFSGLLR